jgi:hypothetical protein
MTAWIGGGCPGSRQLTEHDLRIHCTMVLCYPNGSEKGEATTARTRMRPWPGIAAHTQANAKPSGRRRLRLPPPDQRSWLAPFILSRFIRLTVPITRQYQEGGHLDLWALRSGIFKLTGWTASFQILICMLVSALSCAVTPV